MAFCVQCMFLMIIKKIFMKKTSCYFTKNMDLKKIMLFELCDLCLISNKPSEKRLCISCTEDLIIQLICRNPFCKHVSVGKRVIDNFNPLYALFGYSMLNWIHVSFSYLPENTCKHGHVWCECDLRSCGRHEITKKKVINDGTNYVHVAPGRWVV